MNNYNIPIQLPIIDDFNHEAKEGYLILYGKNDGIYYKKNNIEYKINVSENTSHNISIGLKVPEGFNVVNSPISSSGEIEIQYADGYHLPSLNKQLEWDNKAPLNSPNFTGIPTATTPTLNSNNNQIATTEFVKKQLVAYSNINEGAITTTSNIYIFQNEMVLNDIPQGSYLLSYGNWMSHNTANGEVTIQIVINNIPLNNSVMLWSRGGNQGNTNGILSYNNFPIFLEHEMNNIQIFWRTNTGIATSNNRYITILKINNS
jgi:hypothetical protein